MVTVLNHSSGAASHPLRPTSAWVNGVYEHAVLTIH